MHRGPPAEKPEKKAEGIGARGTVRAKIGCGRIRLQKGQWRANCVVEGKKKNKSFKPRKTQNGEG